jgi:nitroreductase
MKNITQTLEWRYATKHYDTTKKISDTDLHTLKESIRLSPSSYGLQPFKVIEVTNGEIREKLKAASWNQSQLTDASSIFVFSARADIIDTDIDAFIALNAQVRNVSIESLAGYANMIKGTLSTQTPEQKHIWAAKQSYIALGFVLGAAAILEIDATPMEGFDKTQYDAILGLSEKGLKSVVVCALGYRSSEDTSATLPKVRQANEDMFIQA